MPDISIIVPIYNVEKYLKRCLDSLVNQTLKNIEIILVNDGSLDNCGNICNMYAENDKRIKVIHKKNGGLGFARNSGLEAAAGEYVAFVDSDDYVSEDMYEKLYTEAKSQGADTCLCGFNRVTSTGCIKVFENPLNRSVFKEDRILKDVLANMLGAPPAYFQDDFVGMSAWKGIYSNKIIKQNKVRFCSEREFISEDVIFNLDYFLYSRCTAVITDALYYYCENNASLTKSYRKDRYDRCRILYKEVSRRIENLGITEYAKNNADRTFIANSRVCIIQEVMNSETNGVKNAKRNIYDICSDSLLQNVLKKYPILKMPVKQRIFSIFTKYKSAKILFFLVKINYNSQM